MAAPVKSMNKPTGERTPCNTTSFQKKSRSKLVSIPGTRPSIQNGQLIVSTGVTSLDYLIGGGLAVGTVLLVEEDCYDSYSRMLLKYFLSEGVVCGHEIFIGSAQDHPDDFLQELPAPILDDVASTNPLEVRSRSCDPDCQDSMKIAWRYQNLPRVQSPLASSSRFGHYYDVSKTMDAQIRQTANCHGFFLPEHSAVPDSDSERSPLLQSYSALLQSLQEVIHKEGFDTAAPPSKSRNVLRVGLHSLGSALWGDDLCCRDNPGHGHALSTFLYGLRALLRSSLSVAMVTVPSHLIQSRAMLSRITRLCDTAVCLESFRGSERETNPLYKDYHGLLHVRQVPHLNCLVSELADHKDLAFQLKRKQFTIERLHLPPDLSETVSRVSRGA
ncbi:elongator complex protein 4, partial [Osmerus mordax]|uniref:elongator complex protein 4 n=1 Tax=Osmerus mordax TaxID=8014 RepID=UPI00350FEFC1